MKICLLYMFICLLIFTNIKSLIRYIRVKKYLLKKITIDTTEETTNKVCVIIPVYNEVHNIEKSVRYFKELQDICDVYYVTTSKEKNEATYKEVEAQIKQQGALNVYVYNSPNTEGTMAHQLNYMAKKLPKESIIGVYNVDSLPAKETFEFVLNNINKDEAYQQVSFFDDNISNSILRSAQNWQNRWSLIYEMGKYLKRTGKCNFVYTIGHGLFIHKSILEDYGYWSEKEINEDNEFGYRLVCNNIQVKPIPFMEKADFAKSVRIYIKQQSTWINGPLYAFSYYKKLQDKSTKKLWLAILNFKAYIRWMFFPVLFLLFTMIAATYKLMALIILIGLMITYITLWDYLANDLLIRCGYLKKRHRINVLSDIIFFIIHSWGGFITITKIMTGKNNQRNKYNTEK